MFDKTGTLTTGQFGVSQVDGLERGAGSHCRRHRAGQPHPIARAIIDHCKPAAEPVTDLKNIAGYGLAATVDGSQWLVGTTRLLQREGVEYPYYT